MLYPKIKFYRLIHYVLKLGVILCICILNVSAYADDALILVSPENQARYHLDHKEIVDFTLTQKMQRQFLKLRDVLDRYNIKTIIANGRAESNDSYNSNWFLIDSYNTRRYMIILPKQHAHQSNLRPEYIKHLLNDNGYSVDQVEDLVGVSAQDAYLDLSNLVFDRNYRKFYLYTKQHSSIGLLNLLQKHLSTSIISITPQDNIDLKISQIMNLKEQFAMICPKCFRNVTEYTQLKEDLMQQNKTILEITPEQASLNATDFIVINSQYKRYVVMNKMSFDALSLEHKKFFLNYCALIIADLSGFYSYDKTRLVDMIAVVH
jgi:hypothetical protein